MNVESLKKLISDIKKGKVETAEALETLKTLPFEEMGFATLDDLDPANADSDEPFQIVI